ncbi:hypothetical protein DOTSEDRAFT_80474 [Dothistroma septosporum NZE10]|uniref:Uncharacterized protein n=1 Tax=Dothistroma septosporum (strain NZE10 / CBS 128990) TaxID=675120 RepID=M2YLX7_DOTSN|nr:hypothetical protein DOTSEDRAFT_80474 [Dothistroma septosporum NZE10]
MSASKQRRRTTMLYSDWSTQRPSHLPIAAAYHRLAADDIHRIHSVSMAVRFSCRARTCFAARHGQQHYHRAAVRGHLEPYAAGNMDSCVTNDSVHAVVASEQLQRQAMRMCVAAASANCISRPTRSRMLPPMHSHDLRDILFAANILCTADHPRSTRSVGPLPGILHATMPANGIQQTMSQHPGLRLDDLTLGSYLMRLSQALDALVLQQTRFQCLPHAY